MKIFFTFIISLILCLGIADYAYADDSEQIRYVFVTSCGNEVEIVIEGLLTEEQELLWWEYFDGLLCSHLGDLGDKEDILP